MTAEIEDGYTSCCSQSEVDTRTSLCGPGPCGCGHSCLGAALRRGCGSRPPPPGRSCSSTTSSTSSPRPPADGDPAQVFPVAAAIEVANCDDDGRIIEVEVEVELHLELEVGLCLSQTGWPRLPISFFVDLAIEGNLTSAGSRSGRASVTLAGRRVVTPPLRHGPPMIAVNLPPECSGATSPAEAPVPVHHSPQLSPQPLLKIHLGNLNLEPHVPFQLRFGS